MRMHIFPLEKETPENDRVSMFILQNIIRNFEFSLVRFPNSTTPFKNVDFPPIHSQKNPNPDWLLRKLAQSMR